MSTSALLVCELTQTNIYKRPPHLSPFLAAGAIYLAAGIGGASGEADTAIADVLRSSFHFHPVLAVPAAAILVMSLLRADVKKTMAVSILTAALISCSVQAVSLPELRWWTNSDLTPEQEGCCLWQGNIAGHQAGTAERGQKNVDKKNAP